MPPLETPEIEKTFTAIDFSLPSTRSKNYSLRDVVTDNGFIVAFICNHCPYVRAIASKIVREAEELLKIGVGFVAINSNDTKSYPEDSFDNMKLFAEKHHFSFPYLFDESQQVARAYKAVCTPDFFCFDRNKQLKYRGRLDAAGKNDMPNATRELFLAMQMVAADQSIDHIKQYPSIGCSIKWKEHD